jgi:hypothetical protein
MYVNSDDGKWVESVYTVGAMADSFYEYLLKYWLLTDGDDGKYRSWYDTSVQVGMEPKLFSNLSYIVDKRRFG